WASMRLLDERYLKTPCYGGRRLRVRLARQGYPVNRQRVRRLLGPTGPEAVYPRPRTTVAGAGHRVYPCRPRGLAIDRVRQVRSSDITDVPLAHGSPYLAAGIDGHG